MFKDDQKMEHIISYYDLPNEYLHKQDIKEVNSHLYIIKNLIQMFTKVLYILIRMVMTLNNRCSLLNIMC